MNHSVLYWVYFTAAGVTLLAKLYRYVGNRALYGESLGKAVKTWFAEKTAENLVSWLATGLIVWVAGYLFIERAIELKGWAGEIISYLPVSAPTVALAGCLAEIIAPNVMKCILKKLTDKLEQTP